MANEFSVGDLVMLKSGGPCMTVTKVDVGNLVECMWYPASMNRPGEWYQHPCYKETVPAYALAKAAKEKPLNAKCSCTCC